MRSDGKKVRRFATLIQPDRLRPSDIGDLSQSLVPTRNQIQDDEPPRDENDRQDASTALAVLECGDPANSCPFKTRTLHLGSAVLVGRANGRTNTAGSRNGFFDCKVLSRAHAVLWYEEGRFYLKDLKSSNGSFVNRGRLTADREEIFAGDLVQLGQDVYDGNDRHRCIIARVARLEHPGGREDDRSREEAAGAAAAPLADEDNAKAMRELKNCIEEMAGREKTLRRKLQEAKGAAEAAAGAARDEWERGVAEDVLLDKIDYLMGELEGKEGGAGRLERRMRLEENLKRLLFEASRAKVAAEVRAYRAEERQRRGDGRDKSSQTEGGGNKCQGSQTDSEEKSRQLELAQYQHRQNQSTPAAQDRIPEILVELQSLHLSQAQSMSERLSRLEAALLSVVRCQGRSLWIAVGSSLIFSAIAVAAQLFKALVRRDAALVAW